MGQLHDANEPTKVCNVAIGGSADGGGMGSARSSLMMLTAVLVGASGMAGLAQSAGDLAKLNAQVAELYQAGKYVEGTEIAEQYLALAERQFGPSHREVADPLSKLGKLYWAQGRVAEAEPLLKRALAIYEKFALGLGHPSLATALSDLAAVYQAQGRTVEAEFLLERSLALQENASALKQANGLDQRALGLYKSGNADEAIPLATRALELREQALPAGDDAIAESLSRLAILYQARGELAEAEGLFKRALALREQEPVKQVGKITMDFRPQLAESLNNLAALYKLERRLVEAESLSHRAIAIYDELGVQFLLPDLADSLSNLGDIYQANGKLAEAERPLKRALAIYDMVLPPGHPQIATSLNNLAAVYKAQGRLAEAEPLQERALQMRRRQEPR
jgi:tetratricopeptide (TPR) repeat protein